MGGCGWRELPLHPSSLSGDMKTPRRVVDSAVSGHSHKGSKVTRFITYGSQQWGCGCIMSGGRAVLRPRSGEQDTGSRGVALLLIRWLGQRSLTFLRLKFKCPGKSQPGTWGRNLKCRAFPGGPQPFSAPGALAPASQAPLPLPLPLPALSVRFLPSVTPGERDLANLTAAPPPSPSPSPPSPSGAGLGLTPAGGQGCWGEKERPEGHLLPASRLPT